MTQTSISHEAAQKLENQEPTSRLTLRWALKRAILGIAILVVTIGGTAWLLHSSTDNNAEAGSFNASR